MTVNKERSHGRGAASSAAALPIPRDSHCPHHTRLKPLGFPSAPAAAPGVIGTSPAPGAAPHQTLHRGLKVISWRYHCPQGGGSASLSCLLGTHPECPRLVRCQERQIEVLVKPKAPTTLTPLHGLSRCPDRGMSVPSPIFLGPFPPPRNPSASPHLPHPQLLSGAAFLAVA